MMRKFKRQTITVIVFLVAIGCVVWNYYTPNEIANTFKIAMIERSIRSVANRAVCEFVDLPVYSPEIMKFYKPVGKINCGNALDDWVACDKSICYVKPEIIASHEEVICSYTDIIRKNDYKAKYGKTTKTKEPYVLKESDFVKVSCTSKNSESSWSGLLSGIRDNVELSPKVDQQSLDILLTGVNNEKPTVAYFNVLMLGFDSMSHNAVIRKLPKSYEYLTKKLNASVLKGYNIVGDGTPQALVPILTGFTELELPETRKKMPDAKHVDVYPIIWKQYAKYGYVTSFNEDIPDYGTFTYRMKGFLHQPVHHYLRTFYVEAQNSFSSNMPHCIGHKPDHLIMLDYTRNFMLKYVDTPNFIFSFHGGLSHDSINLIGAADDDLYEFLQILKDKHILDNTILIFMADHGNRFAEIRNTFQGKLEERLPFFSFLFPEAFKNEFPQQYANFVENSKKLTTPFDIHATLKDILELQKQKKFNAVNMAVDEDADIPEISLSSYANKRAISLFDLIPQNRSCADAYIEPHWCACLNWEKLPLDGDDFTGRLLQLAGSIVATINNATMSYRNLCAKLELKQINWAMRLKPSHDFLKFKGTKDTEGFIADMSKDIPKNFEEMYQLQIIVTPGNSLFEASIRYNPHTMTATTQLSEVSRINKYSTQAHCIYERDPELRKYCYCT